MSLSGRRSLTVVATYWNIAMTQIVLTQAQAQVLAGAEDPVAVCRPDGSLVGWLVSNSKFVIPDRCPFTPEEIAAAEKDGESDGPWHSTKEVFDHLRTLQ